MINMIICKIKINNNIIINKFNSLNTNYILYYNNKCTNILNKLKVVI